MLAVIAPLIVFSAHLERTRRHGLDVYRTLPNSYVANFDEKWVRGGEPILGTSDIQSLVDMANSYAVVREMRVVPFALKDLKLLVFATVIPFLPLLLTIMPLPEMINKLMKVVF